MPFLVTPEIRRVRTKVGIRRGRKLKLECVIDAYPDPIIYWSSANGKR